jgi:hypothetical protein
MKSFRLRNFGNSNSRFMKLTFSRQHQTRQENENPNSLALALRFPPLLSERKANLEFLRIENMRKNRFDASKGFKKSPSEAEIRKFQGAF